MTGKHGAVGDSDILARYSQNDGPAHLLPDLIVMQSSPTDIWQSLICTLRQDSGFTPSVFGEGALSMVIPFMVTLSQNSGLTVQKGEFMIFTPSIFTFLQRTG